MFIQHCSNGIRKGRRFSIKPHCCNIIKQQKTQVGTTTTTYQAVVAANANGGNRKASS
jgi:hypothetical protein